jgi:hypothetical protein
MRKAVAVFLCALSFTACGGDDDGGNSRESEEGKLGDDEKDEPGNDGRVAAGKLSDDELSEEVVAKFVECGLQAKSDARTSSDEGIDDDFDRCIARCTLATTCNNLKQSVCTEPSGMFGSCLEACDPAPDDGFACKDGTKIPHLFLCNGLDECADGEDELKCNDACEDGSTPATTVTACDGKKDCRDGSDEAGCPICS